MKEDDYDLACEHDWTNTRVSYDEVEELCVRCGAVRKGHIAWGDWEKEG